MARRVSSSSCRRACIFCHFSAPILTVLGSEGIRSEGLGFQVKAGHHALGVREVTHQSAEWRRQLLDQRRCGNNLLLSGHFGLLVNVDHFKLVTALEALVAQVPNVVDGTS